MKHLLFVMAFAALTLEPIAALAGTTGSYSGIVVDLNGRPVAGVKISIASQAAIGVTQTDAHGYFLFLTLPPDTYGVVVQREAYEPFTTRITVGADLFPWSHVMLWPRMKIFHVWRPPSPIERFVRPEAGNDIYEVPLGSPLFVY